MMPGPGPNGLQVHSLQLLLASLAAKGLAPLGLCHACCIEYKQAMAGQGQPGAQLPKVEPAVTMVSKAEVLTAAVPGGQAQVAGVIPVPICDRHMVILRHSQLATG